MTAIPQERARVQAVIFDWAGTTVDYGCFAPLSAFMKVFEARGIDLTAEEARRPMGMLKRDHIKALCGMERIGRLWLDRFGSEPDEADIDALYADFEPLLFERLSAYTEPLPDVVRTIDRLRSKGVKIGSTSGYTASMLDIVARAAETKGYRPDCRIAADQVPAGRPAPYMCFQNALRLQVYPLDRCLKVGDTISDVQEGVNAGMWSVGVVMGGSELGLAQKEVEVMDRTELAERMNVVRERFRQAGAHFVADSFQDVESIVEEVNARLAADEGLRSIGRKRED